MKSFGDYLKETVHFYLALYVSLVLVSQIAIFKDTSYYTLRKTVPLTLFFGTQTLERDVKIKGILYALVGALCVGFLAFRYRYDWMGGWEWTRDIIGLTWRHWVYIEYALFALIYFELFSRKLGHQLKSLGYTTLLMPVVGFMYEIPTYHLYESFELFSLGCPFILRSSVIGFAVLCWKGGAMTFTQKRVVVACALLSLFYVFHFFYPSFAYPRFSWVVRLPTCLFWVAIVSSWKVN